MLFFYLAMSSAVFLELISVTSNPSIKAPLTGLIGIMTPRVLPCYASEKGIFFIAEVLLLRQILCVVLSVNGMFMKAHNALFVSLSFMLWTTSFIISANLDCC